MQQPSSKPITTPEVSLSQDIVSQEDVNQLYETYYHRIHQAIAEKKDSKPLLILLGETHNESLLYNLIVFEIVRNTGKFNHLFIEQGKDFSEIFDGIKSRNEFKKAEKDTYYKQNSFLYLYFFANSLNIPTVSIEEDSYRFFFEKASSSNNKKQFESALLLRDHQMATNASAHLTQDGINVLLCGSGHLPGLESQFNAKKNCHILSLDKQLFTLYDEAKKEKSFPAEAREIHAMVLQAQLNFMVKTGEFGAALVTDSDSPSSDSVKPKEKKISSTPTLSKITGFFSTSRSPAQSSAPSSEKAFDADSFKQTIKDELESFSFSLPGILSRPLNDRLELLEDLSESGEIQDWLAETYDLFAKNDRWQQEDAKPIFNKLDAWLDSMKSLHGMTKK